jgi:hypothetical protein
LKFDIILAFSVFTHTHQKEMLELVEQLRRLLAPRGVLAFTFCDPAYDRSLTDHRLAPGAGVIKMSERWCVEVDGRPNYESEIPLDASKGGRGSR